MSFLRRLLSGGMKGAALVAALLLITTSATALADTAVSATLSENPVPATPATAVPDAGSTVADIDRPLSAQHARISSLTREYVWGIGRYELDHRTRLTGWQVADSWYFGRARGAGSGLALVWQGHKDQFSVSRDGLRFTRRF